MCGVNMEYIEKRIEKARSLLKDENEGIFLISVTNREYFSGFNSSDGFMFIFPQKVYLFLDFRYYESAKIKKEAGKIPENMEILLRDRNASGLMKEVLLQNKIKKLYFEDNRITVSSLEHYKGLLCEVEFLCGGTKLDSFRAQKDLYEIESIKKAQSITDKVFCEMLEILKPGMTENDVALEIDYRLRRNGASKYAFSTIAVSGAKSSLPHGVPDNTVITKGFLTMDFGACYNGYISDMTRTVCFGKPDEEMIKVYDTVLEAQKVAFEKIHSGVEGKVVDLAAREYIYSAGYRGCFGHSTGHSVGLEVHESPNFSSSESTLIPENAVISVEPGIYIEGKFGVRTEDLVLVTPDGYENLTKSSKKLIVL